MNPFLMDAVLIVALAAAIVSALKARTLIQQRTEELNRKIEELEQRIHEFLSRPEKWEYRIERFDVLWYAVVTSFPTSREVTAVAAGMPHCPKCILPMSLANQEWSCRQCGEKRPESLADVAVMDSITKLALQYFQERHPDYRTALRKQA